MVMKGESRKRDEASVWDQTRTRDRMREGLEPRAGSPPQPSAIAPSTNWSFSSACQLVPWHRDGTVLVGTLFLSASRFLNGHLVDPVREETRLPIASDNADIAAIEVPASSSFLHFSKRILI